MNKNNYFHFNEKENIVFDYKTFVLPKWILFILTKIANWVGVNETDYIS